MAKRKPHPPIYEDWLAGKGCELNGGSRACRGCRYSSDPDLFDGVCLYYEMIGEKPARHPKAVAYRESIERKSRS